MSVILLEPGLRTLLEAPAFEIAVFCELVADEVVLEAQANVVDYFQSAPALAGSIAFDVRNERINDVVAVGIGNAGRKSRRLAEGHVTGRIRWLTKAREAVALRRVGGG